MNLLSRVSTVLMSAVIAVQGISISSAKRTKASAETAVVISPIDTYEINNGVFEGWGTSLCWWANRIGYSDSLSQQAADAFYGDNGLRLNIARFNIGGGDDPSHDHITRTDSNMPGYTTYKNGKVEYDWTADANQRNVLKRCVEAAGEDAIVEMFSNSPPYYMTNSGCTSGAKDAGKNNLRDDSYTAFAEYLAEVCRHYRDEWGIDIQSVEAMNEPYTNYWGAYSYKQEGCHFDIGASESKIITELQKSMASRGMGDVIICGTDETSIDTQIDAFNALSAEAKNAISRIDTHTYGGSKRSQLKELALSSGKNLWMSEVDGNGTAGSNAGEMSAALWLAQRITTDCNDLNASAWILWQVIDKHICAAGYNGKKDSGMPDISTGFWGTAVADHDKDTIILTKKYYAFGQYSRYIRPGMTMLNSSGTTMAAYDEKNGQLVLVAYNTSGNSENITFDLTQFDEVGTYADAVRTSLSENWANAGKTEISGKILKATMPANSITTYIIGGVKGNTEMGQKITPVSLSGSNSWKNDSTYGYEKVFDGDNSTFFDGLGNGWVQMDLGEMYEISAVGFCPRSGYEYRCADGMFMVSDDGINWKTVYTISGRPSFGMHYAKIGDENVTGRYVRYQVPEGTPNNGVNKDNVYCCNMAEIEVYGKSIKLSGFNKIDITPENITGSEPWKQSQNTADKVFDGNNNTYFDGTGNGWVQADLGKNHKIDAIGFFPRKGYEYRCPDSVFMVSQDGINWTKIHTINSVPESKMNYIYFSDNVQARYIRYQVPEGTPNNGVNKDNVYCCNMAELEIYGKTSNVYGDVNADGNFDIADLVMLSRFILGNGELNDYSAADLCHDESIDIFDLTAMRILFSSSLK